MTSFIVAQLTEEDVTDPGDDLLHAVNAFDNRMWAESDPGEPPCSVAISRMKLTESWHGFERRRWVATSPDHDGIVGMAEAHLHIGVDDDPTASAAIEVDPEVRRQGVGRRLLGEAVAFARSRGRTIIGGDTSDRVPSGDAFAEFIGASPKLVQRESECRLDEVDSDMIDRWLHIPSDVIAEYELWRSTGPYPEDAYAAIAEIQNVMNTQPFDDVERRDVNFTAAHVAHGEARRDWSLGDRWTHFIRHRPSGRLVGYTRIYLWNDWPGIAEQGDTGVDHVHRGRGLGKWLKGSMARHLLDERPDCSRIRTTNAFTNDAMLAINEAMGFKVTRSFTTWQAPVAAVVERLAAAST